LFATKQQLTRIDFHSRFSLSRFTPTINNNTDSVQVVPVTSYFQSDVHYLRSQFNRIIALSPTWHQLINQLGESLEQIAYGTKTLDRALAVLLGFTELVFLSLIHLSSGLDQQTARFVSETIANGMKQQVMVRNLHLHQISQISTPFIPVFRNTMSSKRFGLYSVSPYSCSPLLLWSPLVGNHLGLEFVGASGFKITLMTDLI
jgi:hypothetical protein